MFAEADKWMKNAKLKLDNFEANKGNPHYIAFDMLANAKDDFMKKFLDNYLTARAEMLDNDMLSDTDPSLITREIEEFKGKIEGSELLKYLLQANSFIPFILYTLFSSVYLTFS